MNIIQYSPLHLPDATRPCILDRLIVLKVSQLTSVPHGEYLNITRYGLLALQSHMGNMFPLK
jgi:hypothetical protein